MTRRRQGETVHLSGRKRLQRARHARQVMTRGIARLT
jgi:hypothetical protein